jgi:hypothetical protein
MITLTAIHSDVTAQQAEALLEQAGWRQVGAGDWSRVLADPSDAWAARITPFDPAYRPYADACLSGPPLRWLPNMTMVIPLRREGYVVVMERLWPAKQDAAAAFCAALGIGCDSSQEANSTEPFDVADDVDLTSLRAFMRELLAEGARRFQLWGGSDIRPGNVMVDDHGQLKLVDPMFLRGQAIVEALRDGRRDRLSDFPRCQLEDFLAIPFFESEGTADDLRRRLALLYDETVNG